MKDRVQKSKVMIVEDDTSLLSLIVFHLEKNNFSVIQAQTGDEAITLFKENIPDIAILDWMIPSPSGLELCRILRKQKETAQLPIILLTAKGEEEDRIRGLETGADDYITKPFSNAELIARVKALLRRSTKSIVHHLEFRDIDMNLNEHKVFRRGKKINLGPIEYKLLKHFLKNPRRVYSREQLLDSVWGHGIYVEARTVDTHIRRLRKAINITGTDNYIRTVRSAGYSIDSD